MLVEGDVHQLFRPSNIEPGYVDFCSKVLDVVLSETKWRPSDVLAISLTEQPQQLAVVSKAGIALGAPKGVFRLRVEVQSFPYEAIAKFVREHDERYGSSLEAIGRDSAQLFRIRWAGMGGLARDPKAERDRFFDPVLTVWEAA